MPAKSAEKNVAADRTLVIRRTFEAPRELVWKAWAEVEHAKMWWGSKGFSAPVVELGTRPGDKWRSKMVSPDGKDYWQHGVLREIIPPEKLSFTFVWDEDPDHEMLVTVTLAERAGKTEMVFRQERFKSVEERDSHKDGWTESFDRLAAYLRKMNGATRARK